MGVLRAFKNLSRACHVGQAPLVHSGIARWLPFYVDTRRLLGFKDLVSDFAFVKY